MNSYCALANGLPVDSPDPNKHYHDRLYGFPIEDDNELFGRLLLEINQAGLSWTLILQRAAGLRAAYADFNIAAVAAFGEADRQRLLTDAKVIRNRLKIQAAIKNARTIQRLQSEYGSFRAWLDAQPPQDKTAWVKLFKKTFTFTGGEITGEFLMSSGYLPGAHQPDCPVYPRILAARPRWAAQEDGNAP